MSEKEQNKHTEIIYKLFRATKLNKAECHFSSPEAAKDFWEAKKEAYNYLLEKGYSKQALREVNQGAEVGND